MSEESKNQAEQTTDPREVASQELEGISGGDTSQTLQSQDKLGNTQIQTLMSDYNEAQTTLASIQKTAHDTKSTEIGKI